MNEKLIATLGRLQSDPSVVVELYAQLYVSSFWVLSQASANVEPMQFLTYATDDDSRELPAFTLSSRSMLTDLARQVPATQIQEVEGPFFWARVLLLLQFGSFFVAVDPGERHGIRLSREMILGMVTMQSAE